MAVLSIVVLLFWVLGAWTRRLSPSFPQLVPYMKAFAVDGVWTVLLNLWSFLVSWNKGLAIFAPLTVIALFLLPRSFASAWAESGFAVLSLTFLAAGHAMFLFWTDETWGPRYLHGAVCPLLLALGTVRGGWTLPRRALLGLAAAVGLVVSVLGATVYYGHEFVAAGSIEPITLQALQHDPVWNHPRFNGVLLSIWATGRTVRWPPPDRVWFAPPPGMPPAPTVDLRPFASPQSVVLLPTAWHGSWRGVVLVLALVAGLGAIAGALRAAARGADERTPDRRRSAVALAPPHHQ